MITEDSIRESLEHGASQAPGPDEVLAALPARIRAARRRRMAAVAAGTAAVVLTVPAVVAVTGMSPLDRNDGVATRPSGTGSVYGPTWLPPGLYETSRHVSSWLGPERYERTWSFGQSPKSAGPQPYVSLSVAQDDRSPLDPLPPVETQTATPGRPPGSDLEKIKPSHESVAPEVGGESPPPETGTEKVQVKGHPAVQERSSLICAIAWRPTPEQLLTVVSHDMGNDCLNATRVANSVVPDPSATITDAIRVGRVPEGYLVRSRSEVRGAPSGCVARLGIGPADRDTDPPAPSPADHIEYGHGALPGGGTPLTVGGRPARYHKRLEIDDTPLQVVAVDLGGGRRLLVSKDGSKPVSQAALVEFAGQISVGDPPTCNWLRLRY